MTQYLLNRKFLGKASPSKTTLLSLICHKSEISLTAMIWLFSFGLIVVTGQQLIRELSPVSAFKESISFYGLGLATISLLIIAWSFFRLFRYEHSTTKNRKKPAHLRLNEVRELVKIFKLAPDVIAELRKSNYLNVKFGTTETSSTFPVISTKGFKDEHTIYLCS